MPMRLVLSALVLACAAPALAESVSVAVPYGDLDLTAAAGRKTLDERLERAARRVCGGVSPVRNMAQMREWRACRAEARASYEAQVALALDAANARRVAVLADKLGMIAGF
jgi:UrcA family protein